MSTLYHAKYYAHCLTRRSTFPNIEKLSLSLFDACVNIHPHQIEATLFAFKSPLSKGVILADEVGLGKTIEAGLVLCQYWAERKRRLIVIVPASLRKQWSLELEEKFNLPTLILDSNSFKRLSNEGFENPFQQDAVVITSMHFANNKQLALRTIPWDLVVIDEAHKLRNVYRPSNKIGKGIKRAFEGRRKVLLTATPLQNSLLELYGLSTLLDDYIFGDEIAFRSQYMSSNVNLDALRTRLQGFCKRTLRKQVLEYVKYTERRTITRTFCPSDSEQRLYDAVSDFLQRDDTFAIPESQKTLVTLIVRKLLASSSQAVAGTLLTMKERLEHLREGYISYENMAKDMINYNEMADELLDEVEGEGVDTQDAIFSEIPDMARINGEIAELQRYIDWARSIHVDAKTHALISALEIGFSEMERMGASRKALIFTESRRTQDYLKSFLQANGYSGKIVILNGSNSDSDSNSIYEEWVKSNSHRASGSRIIDRRIAIIEYFRDSADIMIATESGAEGINLQFCSLVINYDLPWNPQRIEQRIGRCHRYGQKHDVVVINFLNEGNEVDRRVYELLTEKFSLFTGVLGASDEVLGSIESGVDFEKRILAIYQQCRTPEEIERAFKVLQEDMEESIRNRFEDTRRTLLENFDEDVHARLRINLKDTKYQLDKITGFFWTLTRIILGDHARFNDEDFTFTLDKSPVPGIDLGKYTLILKDRSNERSAFLYRASHPLGEYVIDRAKMCHTPPAEVIFSITQHPTRISMVEALRGKGGYLILTKLTIDSFDRAEYLLFNGFTDEGTLLDQEVCEKLFSCQAIVCPLNFVPEGIKSRLNKESKRHMSATISGVLEENDRHFQEEREQLEKWADDLILSAEKELRDTKIQLQALKRQSRFATDIEEQHSLQVRIRELEKNQRRKRQRIFDVEDEIIAKRDELIDNLEKRMAHQTWHEILFMIRWRVI